MAAIYAEQRISRSESILSIHAQNAQLDYLANSIDLIWHDVWGIKKLYI